MIQKSRTWALLKSLKPVSLTKANLAIMSEEKVKDTVKYSMRQDPTQDQREVARRCLVAILGEQIVKEQVHGYMPSGQEDHENPYSYAYDVVAKDGVRIEVKTHQAKSKWIDVNTGMSGDYPSQQPGINLGPFLNHKLADLIIIFDTKQDGPGRYLFTPKLMAGRDAFAIGSRLVQKSQYNDGYYLRTCNPEEFNFHQFTS